MFAGVAHPVERHLAKVEVASSSLVTRSKRPQLLLWSFLCVYVDNCSGVNAPVQHLRRNIRWKSGDIIRQIVKN